MGPTERAVLFDMDGVLVDSEPVIRAAAIAALKEWGVSAAPEDFLPWVGMGEIAFIGNVAKQYGVDYVPAMKDRTYALYLDLVRARGRPFAGILELLAELRRRGVPFALASSADRVKVDANLAVLDRAPSYFDALVTGDDVERKKPFPDLFLEASRRLGVAPERCCVVEDAPAGLEAAKAAGMRAVGVSSTFPAERLARADAVVASPAELTPELLFGPSGKNKTPSCIAPGMRVYYSFRSRHPCAGSSIG